MYKILISSGYSSDDSLDSADYLVDTRTVMHASVHMVLVQVAFVHVAFVRLMLQPAALAQVAFLMADSVMVALVWLILQPVASAQVAINESFLAAEFEIVEAMVAYQAIAEIVSLFVATMILMAAIQS